MTEFHTTRMGPKHEGLGPIRVQVPTANRPVTTGRPDRLTIIGKEKRRNGAHVAGQSARRVGDRDREIPDRHFVQYPREGIASRLI